MEIRLPLARASRLALGLGLACRETRLRHETRVRL